MTSPYCASRLATFGAGPAVENESKTSRYLRLRGVGAVAAPATEAEVEAGAAAPDGVEAKVGVVILMVVVADKKRVLGASAFKSAARPRDFFFLAAKVKKLSWVQLIIYSPNFMSI